MESPSVAIVIPARMGSSRFPGKPLVQLAGKPMIQWVVEAALASGITETVVVATPDLEIVSECSRFGATSILTRSDHPSGTDRIAEASEKLSADIYINVQGDEPLIEPASISACAGPLLGSEEILMSSVYSGCLEEDVENPAVVKVVTDRRGFALYFSRYPIPFPRSARNESVKRHVGIYGYRREALLKFSSWKVSPLEGTENLEQLRFLENGIGIMMSRVESSETGVDTPEQAEAVAIKLQQRELLA